MRQGYMSRLTLTRCTWRTLARRAASTSSIIYPAPPPPGRHSGRMMDPDIWPKISPIWPSSAYFAHDVSTLHDEDDVAAVAVGDARTIEAKLNTHGFELLKSRCNYDFEDEVQVEQYKEATAQIPGSHGACTRHCMISL